MTIDINQLEMCSS